MGVGEVMNLNLMAGKDAHRWRRNQMARRGKVITVVPKGQLTFEDISIKEEEDNKMNLKDEAKAHIDKPRPVLMKNIADLDHIPIDIEIYDGSGTDKAGRTFEYKFIELNGEKYRVPVSVISQLKTALEFNPDLKEFTVKRTGTTKDDTRYRVSAI